MIKVLRILEICWMIVAIAALVLATFKLYHGDNEGAMLFFMFTFIAALLWYLRRRRRIAFEKEYNS